MIHVPTRLTNTGYSPKLAWSASTPEGRHQIACSLVAISNVLNELSGNCKDFDCSVKDLLEPNSNRSDAERKKAQLQFVHGLLARQHGKLSFF